MARRCPSGRRLALCGRKSKMSNAAKAVATPPIQALTRGSVFARSATSAHPIAAADKRTANAGVTYRFAYCIHSQASPPTYTEYNAPAANSPSNSMMPELRRRTTATATQTSAPSIETAIVIRSAFPPRSRRAPSETCPTLSSYVFGTSAPYVANRQSSCSASAATVAIAAVTPADPHRARRRRATKNATATTT